MEELIRTRLLASSGVTDLCGTRIDFGGNAQGAAMPRIALWTVSDAEGHHLHGPDGASQGRIQADCYGVTYSAAKALARAVRAALDGHRNGNLQGAFLLDSRDTREGGANEADRPFRVSLDFATTFNPS